MLSYECRDYDVYTFQNNTFLKLGANLPFLEDLISVPEQQGVLVCLHRMKSHIKRCCFFPACGGFLLSWARASLEALINILLPSILH